MIERKSVFMSEWNEALAAAAVRGSWINEVHVDVQAFNSSGQREGQGTTKFLALQNAGYVTGKRVVPFQLSGTPWGATSTTPLDSYSNGLPHPPKLKLHDADLSRFVL